MKTFCSRLPRAAWLSAALIALSAGPVLAESACKGLGQGPCAGKTDCTWVDGYTRKDGINVSGHCKAASKRDGAAKETTPAAKEKPAPVVVQEKAQTATAASKGAAEAPPAKVKNAATLPAQPAAE
ncbi:hypothetical protein [uncultured Lamprocystis sp.]|jgi:hypothetical protein|uniref:hypothetical protein n=1 Tax=uncultured Lamprocystis sp. TaxID=543132 RepID=UPI0025CCF5A5|nr:hypothetical protein [uncultured Lamprocystis sp.]